MKEVLIDQKIERIGHHNRYSFESSADFKVGDFVFILTKEEERTKRQNDLFHSLLREIYKTGAWSFVNFKEDEKNPMSLDLFKECVKIEHGQGFKAYRWTSKDGFQMLTKEPPEEGKYINVSAILKSTKEYTKSEFSDMIENIKIWVMKMGDMPEKVYEMLNIVEGI